MSCERYREWIAEYARGERAELSTEARRELTAHLAACPACKGEYRQVKALLDLFISEPIPEVPPEVLRQTHENIVRA